MFDVLISGGMVVDGSGLPSFRADVGVANGKIVTVDIMPDAKGKVTIDARGKVVAPGFIDAHVHGDLILLADPYHEPAVRQGVTTYVIGQDGVAMAPASPTTLAYMRRYTAGFSGIHELPQRWSSMGEYLDQFNGKCAINACCLVPNGNLRLDAMGLETRPPSADELKNMRRMMRAAMEEGAVGLSTGMDYIPSMYATTEELIALCKEMTSFGGIYVTHQRRYDAEGLIGSMDEIYRIGREAIVGVHVSHFNSLAHLAIPKMDEGRAAGIDVTFDLYCYLAGSSILGMVALPPWIQEGGIEATIERLKERQAREKLGPWFAEPWLPFDVVKLSFVSSPQFRHLEGKTLPEAAAAEKKSLCDLVCDLLIACDMAAGCVVPHLKRGPEDMKAMMRHPGMMAGSDGVYTGNYPHPRGYGCFARYLGYFVREDKVWRLEEAVSHLSYHAARRFGLKERGLIRENMAADVVIFDPDTIVDRSTFAEGKKLAEGVDTVLVNGEPVLLNGQRTQALPGRGLRRG